MKVFLTILCLALSAMAVIAEPVKLISLNGVAMAPVTTLVGWLGDRVEMQVTLGAQGHAVTLPINLVYPSLLSNGLPIFASPVGMYQGKSVALALKDGKVLIDKQAIIWGKEGMIAGEILMPLRASVEALGATVTEGKDGLLTIRHPKLKEPLRLRSHRE